MARDQVIDAEAMRLALVARKVADYQRRGGERGCRWAAMSAASRCATSCSHGRRTPSAFPVKSMLMPMNRDSGLPSPRAELITYAIAFAAAVALSYLFPMGFAG